ncbi:DMT family transporter [Staphylococcus pettenkoferi]|uniref:DMT family transporter n=1 Tax=Staphylococcus pettenkoferi TaxID=170573 RepID=UPI002274ECC6|nr:multidrug efflux SMR transporter [Staphylococcus pettenkoferi]MCY1573233.1 multidrug efflux SMR transporter [Staphylococcus pettenkoferi]MCY1579396.1 multidrug efflux SMR transporter [Staphylococcus pettenkoferi]
MAYLYLLAAIVMEILATSLLKLSSGFTKLWPTMGTIVTFLFCIYLLGLTMLDLPLNVAYASWCGLGLVLTTLVSILFFKEQVNLVSVISLILIIVGVVMLNLFGSNS